MTQCKFCGKNMSPKAMICPHCGKDKRANLIPKPIEEEPVELTKPISIDGLLEEKPVKEEEVDLGNELSPDVIQAFLDGDDTKEDSISDIVSVDDMEMESDDPPLDETQEDELMPGFLATGDDQALDDFAQQIGTPEESDEEEYEEEYDEEDEGPKLDLLMRPDEPTPSDDDDPYSDRIIRRGEEYTPVQSQPGFSARDQLAWVRNVEKEAKKKSNTFIAGFMAILLALFLMAKGYTKILLNRGMLDMVLYNSTLKPFLESVEEVVLCLVVILVAMVTRPIPLKIIAMILAILGSVLYMFDALGWFWKDMNDLFHLIVG